MAIVKFLFIACTALWIALTCDKGKLHPKQTAPSAPPSTANKAPADIVATAQQNSSSHHALQKIRLVHRSKEFVLHHTTTK
eukprot:1821155-Rhodomonas_salina.1